MSLFIVTPKSASLYVKYAKMIRCIIAHRMRMRSINRKLSNFHSTQFYNNTKIAM